MKKNERDRKNEAGKRQARKSIRPDVKKRSVRERNKDIKREERRIHLL
jgi:hypothetical protein